MIKRFFKWLRADWMLPEINPRDREMNRLREEIRLASVFATFVMEAHNRGFEAKLTIEVDGVPCETGLILSAKEPLLEYLANWACAQHYKKAARLMEFEKHYGYGEFVDQEFEKLWKRIHVAKEMMTGRDLTFGRPKGDDKGGGMVTGQDNAHRP